MTGLVTRSGEAAHAEQSQTLNGKHCSPSTVAASTAERHHPYVKPITSPRIPKVGLPASKTWSWCAGTATITFTTTTGASKPMMTAAIPCTHQLTRPPNPDTGQPTPKTCQCQHHHPSDVGDHQPEPRTSQIEPKLVLETRPRSGKDCHYIERSPSGADQVGDDPAPAVNTLPSSLLATDW